MIETKKLHQAINSINSAVNDEMENYSYNSQNMIDGLLYAKMLLEAISNIGSTKLSLYLDSEITKIDREDHVT